MGENLKAVDNNTQVSWPSHWSSIGLETYDLCPSSYGRIYKIPPFRCRLFSIKGSELRTPSRGLLSSGYPEIDENGQRILSLGFATRADIRKFKRNLAALPDSSRVKYLFSVLPYKLELADKMFLFA